ncbi:fatty acyl-reductase [Lasius niger]|uniref:Fatty acyl-reductase n=1 Tax=Lasius niger TaxID=67767 RepID=A0A0J7L609_LASNI|nr:fatty acyl-reductase [Lasius niger]
MDVLNYFATQEWKFTNDRLHALMAKLTSKDRENFFCDVRDIDWNVYFETYIRGIRVYLIKDPLDTLPQARVKWQSPSFGPSSADRLAKKSMCLDLRLTSLVNPQIKRRRDEERGAKMRMS